MADKMTRSSTDYKKFSFLIENRQTARTHINKLKNAITRNPEILEVQPILVNEKYEIIDGQHRFVAASELGLPIHYTIVKGLNVDTAREMNVLQRKWNTDDYAYSFAKTGNQHYITFNKFRQEHPKFPVIGLMITLGGVESGRMTYEFKSGKFEVNRDEEDATWIIEHFEKIHDVIGYAIPLSKSFISAYLQALKNEEFDPEMFLKHLKSNPTQMHRTGTIRDALRMIEDIHNYSLSVNLIRLY